MKNRNFVIMTLMENVLQQMFKEKYNCRYLVVIFIFIIVILLVSSFFFGRYSNKSTLNKQIEQPLGDKSETKELGGRTIYELSDPVVSPDNNLVLQLKSEEADSSYALSLFIDDFQNPHLPITYVDNVEVDSGMIQNLTGNKDQLQRIFGYISNYITWSPKENKFAVVLLNKIIVYEYKVESIFDDTFLPKRNRISLAILEEFSIGSKFDSFDYPTLLFSGDGNELYFSSKSGIRMLMPDDKIVETQAGYYPSKIYSIPNSPGIAYWISESIDSDGKKISFIVNNGSIFKRYNLTSDFPIDYHHEIEMSPDLQKVCIGWGSSGSRGKILFNINTGKQIKEGTGCIRWISNNEVVVYQSDSSGGGETGNISYYLVNLLNGKKIFLHNYYSGR